MKLDGSCDLPERVRVKIDDSGECWIWTGASDAGREQPPDPQGLVSPRSRLDRAVDVHTPRHRHPPVPSVRPREESVVTCDHGMPTPSSCVSCMDEGNLPVPPRQRETVERYYVAKSDGHCTGCDLPVTVGQHMVATSNLRVLHEWCAP